MDDVGKNNTADTHKYVRPEQHAFDACGLEGKHTLGRLRQPLAADPPSSAAAPTNLSNFQEERVQPSCRPIMPHHADLPDPVPAAAVALHAHAVPPGDYFSPDAMTFHAVDRIDQPSTVSRAMLSMPTSAEVPHHVTGPLQASRTVKSEDVNATQDNDPVSQRRRRSFTEYPQYPNQAHSALHSQRYPEPRRPPFIARALGLRPLSTASMPGVVAIDGLAARTSRTAGNTPTHTPGLFNPRPPLLPIQLHSSDDLPGPYPSPYLHPMQLQPPKETHVADRAVDTYSGRKMINQYEILDEIGRGVHGKVKLARNLETDVKVAIKIVQRHSKKRRLGKLNTPENKVKKEVAILKKVNHPNTVRLIEVIDDPEMTKVYLVLEYCEFHEIHWRTPGDPDIVLEESRLCNDEAKGLPAPDESHLKKKLAKSTAKKRAKAKLRRPRGTRRTASDPEYWSLEYADTDEEEEDDDDDAESSSAPLSRTPSMSLGTNMTAELYSVHDIASHEAASFAPPKTERSRQSVVESTLDSRVHLDEFSFGARQPLNEANLLSQRPFSLPQWQDEKAVSTFPNKSIFDRKQSTAESTLSSATDGMQIELNEELKYVPTMTIPESRAAFRDALVGLEYLHYQGIIHRDIKPPNLLRTKEGRVKISDFGVSHLGKPMREGHESGDVSESEFQDVEDDAELAKTVGTAAFYAPELCYLDTDVATHAVTAQIDVWALGVTLYCLLFAHTPFIADNEYALMRRIAEEEVFIPRFRLTAVYEDTNPTLRSRPPLFRFKNDGKRDPMEWKHDYIDDELYDLLKRLLTKDPKERITLKEVKLHPWVLQDLPDNWLVETDPSRYTQGKKIEISNEEVDEAVIPLRTIDRVKSVVKKALGIGRESSRRRTHSSATTPESSSGSSTAVSQSPSSNGKVTNMKPDDVIATALKASRENHSEHPLSRSLTASPEARETHDSLLLRNPSNDIEHRTLLITSTNLRPGMSPRHASETSTTGSVRTIRQSDIDQHVRTPSPQSRELELSNMILTTEVHRDSGRGTALTDAGRNLLRTIHTRERNAGTHSSDLVSESELLHADPVIGITNTLVAGRVNCPSPLRGTPTSSGLTTPASSRPGSISAHSEPREVVHNNSSVKRLPTSGNVGSPKRHHMSPGDLGGGLSRGTPNYTAPSEEATEEEYRLARDAMYRRSALSDEQQKWHSRTSRPGSAMRNDACPPSPDDDESYGPQHRSAEIGSRRLPDDFFSVVGSRKAGIPFTMQPVSSASSDDHLTSAMSQSTSFPSMPSVISASSSILSDHSSTENLKNDESSDGTTHAGVAPANALEQPDTVSLPADVDGLGYDGEEGGVVTDEDDSDSDEGYLVMNRRRSHGQPSTRSGSISIGSHRDKSEVSSKIKDKKHPRSGSRSSRPGLT